MYLFTLIVIFTDIYWLNFWEKNNPLPSWVEFIPILNFKKDPYVLPLIKYHALTSKSEIIVSMHQDVKLDPCWCSELINQINLINKRDENWGVLGSQGMTPTGQHCKSVRDISISHNVGYLPNLALSFDPVNFCFKKQYASLFSLDLPCIHFIDSDLVLNLKLKNINSYIINSPFQHIDQNINNRKGPPLLYKESLKVIEDKWFDKLKQPYHTTCGTFFPRIFDKYIKTNVWEIISHAISNPWSIYIDMADLSSEQIKQKIYEVEQNTTYPYLLYLIGDSKVEGMPHALVPKNDFENFMKRNKATKVLDTKLYPGWLENSRGFNIHPLDGKIWLKT